MATKTENSKLIEAARKYKKILIDVSNDVSKKLDRLTTAKIEKDDNEDIVEDELNDLIPAAKHLQKSLEAFLKSREKSAGEN